MGAPSEILDLMDRFREHAEAYRLSSYNETQVRREFVDPFFHALGWDVDNERSYAEAYKDVVHEDAIEEKLSDLSWRSGRYGLTAYLELSLSCNGDHGIKKFRVGPKNSSGDHMIERYLDSLRIGKIPWDRSKASIP